MATLSQLESQIQKLQRRADVLRQRKSAEVVANIHALMQEYGLTVADLGKNSASTGRKPGRPAGSKHLVKNAAKSKLPPKYRDPVSGLTWSGHARPPAWIKDAPDRSVFLINGVSGKAASVKNAVNRAGRPSENRKMAKNAQGASA